MKNKKNKFLSFCVSIAIALLSFTTAFSQPCSGTRIPAGNYGALTYGVGNYYIATGDTVTVVVFSINGVGSLCNNGTLKVTSSLRISNGNLTNSGCIAVRGTITLNAPSSMIFNGSVSNSTASITSTGAISAGGIANYGIIQTITGMGDLLVVGNITNQTTGIISIRSRINISNGNLTNYNCIYSALFISVNGAGKGNIVNGLPASASISANTTIMASGTITNFGQINPNCIPPCPCSVPVSTPCNSWLF